MTFESFIDAHLSPRLVELTLFGARGVSHRRRHEGGVRRLDPNAGLISCPPQPVSGPYLTISQHRSRAAKHPSGAPLCCHSNPGPSPIAPEAAATATRSPFTCGHRSESMLGARCSTRALRARGVRGVTAGVAAQDACPRCVGRGALVVDGAVGPCDRAARATADVRVSRRRFTFPCLFWQDALVVPK